MSDTNTAADHHAQGPQPTTGDTGAGTAAGATEPGSTTGASGATTADIAAGASTGTAGAADTHTDSSPQAGTEILPLNEAELTWVRDLLAYAKELGIAESPQALESFFEEQRTAWYAVAEAERADPNPLISLMGAVIGQILVERCEMKWCVLTDEHGTSLAVASEVGSIAMFPMNAVAKRWTGQNMTTLTEFLQLAQAEVRRAREE